jgi:predicted nucleotidyltransferase
MMKKSRKKFIPYSSLYFECPGPSEKIAVNEFMNRFGLTPKDYEILRDVVLLPLKRLADVYLFGSRARGTQHPYSDIDLLYELHGPETTATQRTISDIKEAAEESNLTVKVDLVNAKDLAESYRENVMRERIKVSS